MTYNEALKERDLIGKFRIENGVKWLILVAPKNVQDLTVFMKQFNKETHLDEDCIKFCSDFKYRLYEVDDASY